MKISEVGLAALALGCSHVAFAQSQGGRLPPLSTSSTPNESGTDENAGSNEQIEDIVVTAQKRAQNIQDVPIAVTAVSGDTLSRSGVATTEQLNVAVPGVSLRTTASSFQPSIRGIGTSSNNVENPVALYIDGVYFPNQREGSRELNDVEQISVLKGPQGTLFGRNATAGVIQISTRAPSFDFAGEIKASIDNYATLKTGIYITDKVGEHVAASLSANLTTQGDGWGHNDTTGRDTYKIDHNLNLRGKLLAEMSSVAKLTVVADYMKRRDTMGPYMRPYVGTNLNFPGFVNTGNVYDSVADRDSINSFEGGGVSATFDVDLGLGQFTSITSYRKSKSFYSFDADATPNRGFNVLSDNKQDTLSQELQLAGRSGVLNWTAGIYYFNNDQRNDPLQRQLGGFLSPLATSVGTQNVYGREKTESVAPFAQAEIALNSSTRATVGGRWTYEKRRFEGGNTAILNNGVGVTLVPLQSGSLTVKKPTWRLALDHDFATHILGYVSYNRGIKSGGFNITSPGTAPYLPEKLDAYETGLKMRLFDRRVRFNTAAFYYDYANIQVLQFAAGVQTISNGAKARIYGLDSDIEIRLTPELSITGGISLLNAKFTKYPNAVINVLSPTGGVRPTLGDATGKRVPLAQKFSGTITVSYTKQVSFGYIDANVTENHNGKYFFEPDNFTRQGAYDLINANLGWRSASQKLSASLFVTNLLDKKVLSFAAGQAAVGWLSSFGYPPRQFGVTTSYKF